jgi:hypothetical protein
MLIFGMPVLTPVSRFHKVKIPKYRCYDLAGIVSPQSVYKKRGQPPQVMRPATSRVLAFPAVRPQRSSGPASNNVLP